MGFTGILREKESCNLLELLLKEKESCNLLELSF